MDWYENICIYLLAGTGNFRKNLFFDYLSCKINYLLSLLIIVFHSLRTSENNISSDLMMYLYQLISEVFI